jgi:two-component system sensor histidine kinase/response regulator
VATTDQTLRVLIVDDEPNMRMAVSRALRDYTVRIPDLGLVVGMSTEEAGSGEEGLEMILAEAPDILLLDHKLPQMSGLDVLQGLMERDLDVTTIMITAYASLETAVLATKRGAYDFLAKPFTPTELKSTVFGAAQHLLLQREARRLAEERHRVRFEFISVVSHELKSPLAAIESYLKMFQNRTLGDEMVAYDTIIDRTVTRMDGMRKLVNDLLDLTRIESGQKRREIADLDVAQIAATSIELNEPQAGERGISLTLETAGPVPLRGDAGEIELIFNNLVGNAVKYNRQGGAVTIAVSSVPGSESVDEVDIHDRVRITVADTGIGIAADDLPKLFGEFARIKNEKTRAIEGSGLGLSIVKKLAALYGGDATVASELGVGTTFTVDLRADMPGDEAAGAVAGASPA